MNKKRVAAILILLIVVILSLAGIRVLKGLKNTSNNNSIITNAVEGTNWPIEEIPLIGKEGLLVEDFGEYTCEATISSGVTYEDMRNYLITLYRIGFKPDSDYGSYNPNRMVTPRNASDIKEVTWIAQKGNFYVTVLWAKEGASNDFNIPYEYNFDVNLFIRPENVDITEENQETNVLLEDEIENDYIEQIRVESGENDGE